MLHRRNPFRPQPPAVDPSKLPQETTLPHFRPKPEATPPDAVEKAVQTTWDAPRLLKPQDVAARLGVTKATLERWRSTGEGPAFLKLSSATVRYTAEAVEAFLAERTRASTAQS